ncbi:MAG: NADH:ubiquinone oxidoreductase, subunit iron-sulfur binding protein [Myxococcales bacterium]|nr:NADH:ubiquinone oxidoreductase, subunit iron-sulfur binding protein [Myxococcales bacterium]
MSEIPKSPPTTSAPTAAPGIATGATAGTPELVTLKIDGRSVQVPKGTNVLEAARTIGTSISYFCYHPGLSSPAVCRQCLVEVKGQPKLQPSCYTPVAEGMDVLTESEKVVTARAQMLEFTLVNHPVDCPICDKAGECTLQKMYQEWDGSPSRVDTGKVHKPKVVDLGPEIVLDAERCILCTRCIRVCDEVGHEHQLEMAFRGDREQLTVAPGKRLDNPYSLNTVDVCPVGALTAKDFRFAMRAWELFTTPSVCAGCATGCNDEVHHAHGKIYRLVPRENQDVNKFWMCDEGRFTYKEVGVHRVAAPRIGGETTSMDKALAYAAERLAGVPKELVGVVLNAQATNEDNFLLAKVAAELGITHVYLAGRPPRPERADDILRSADVNPNTAGARILGGAKAKGTQQLNADIISGAVRGLWILGDHVALDDEALAALSKLEVVYQSPHDNFLSDKVSVLLPAATWAEVDGTFTNGKGIVQRIRAAVEPPGEARSHRELIALIAKRLGVTVAATNAKAVFADMKKSVPEFAGASFGREYLPVQLRFAGSRG